MENWLFDTYTKIIDCQISRMCWKVQRAVHRVLKCGANEEYAGVNVAFSSRVDIDIYWGVVEYRVLIQRPFYTSCGVSIPFRTLLRWKRSSEYARLLNKGINSSTIERSTGENQTFTALNWIMRKMYKNFPHAHRQNMLKIYYPLTCFPSRIHRFLFIQALVKNFVHHAR